MSSGMKTMGIGCATRHFLTRRTRHAKGPWTWVQRRTDATGQRRRVTQKLDYALIGDEVRRKVRRCRLVQVPGHDTDHRAIVLKVTTNGEAVRRYRHKAETFPLTLPIGPRTEGEAMFEELQLLQPMVPVRERHTHDWIREGTWIIVDRRAALRKQNKLPRAEGRALTRKIHASLKLDRIERARRAGEELMKNIGSGCIRDAWRGLQGWYRVADGKPAKPCYQTMETQTEAREKLYEHVPSPGEDIPCNIERPPLRDEPPDDQEIRRGVIKSHSHRSTGGSEMRAEDMTYWLRGIEREEKAEEDGEEVYAGAGDT